MCLILFECGNGLEVQKRTFFGWSMVLYTWDYGFSKKTWEYGTMILTFGNE